MSGARSRNKGKVGEREAAKELGRVLGIGMRRGQQFSGLGGDDIVGFKGVHCEVKRCESLSVYNAMGQAVLDAPYDEVPIVLHRRNNRKWLVVLHLDNLGDLADRVIAAKGE